MAGEELPAVGESIGGYRLDRLIATGGMGAVFAATHARLGRKAAVKVLDRQLASDREYVSRFLHEARIANDIRHPNIVDIYDFVETGGDIALVMELLEGPTLHEALRQVKRFSAIQTLNIALQLADAVAAVHRAGVVHRDLKPENLVIIEPIESEFWEIPSFKILDFGIAKQRNAAVDHHTLQGALMGTPSYMAPEQVAGEPVSAATDVYAIGELMFEMASGRRLFDGESVLVLTQKLKNQLPRFDIPRDVYWGDRIVTFVRACVSPAPADRPDVSQLKRDLSELLEEVDESDGAATVLAMEAIKLEDHKPQALPGSDPMSTQMFFDRIVEDFQPPALPPPPKLEPISVVKAMPPVIVGTPVMRAPSMIRAPERAPSWSAPRPPARRPAPRRFLWLLMAPALVVIVWVAVPGAHDRARAGFDALVGATPNPVRRHLAAWKEIHGDVGGTAAGHLAAAVAAHVQDSWPKYEEAEAEIQRALILEPEDAEAIAFYAENELAWKRWLLFGADAEEVMRFLEYAETADPASPGALRARARRAEVLGETARCRELLRGARRNRSDPLAQLLEGECTIDQDPATAESMIAQAAGAMEGLGRAVRTGARARAHTGRYAEALRSLDQRLAADPKNGPALVEAAMIEHAVGHHERELTRLRSATRADGDQLRAQLLLGRAQAELQKDSSAKSTLLSLATNESAPGRYRREAYASLARLEIDTGGPERAIELLDNAASLGADLEADRLRAEALLLEEKPAQVLALLGKPLATEEQVPLIALSAGAHLLNGRPDEAKHAFEEAVAVRPQDPRLFAELAGARALLDDFGAARTALDKILWLDPLEVTEDDRAPRLPRAVADLMAVQLAKMRDASGDPACVDAVTALLRFYFGDPAGAVVAARRSVDGKNSPRIAAVLEGHLIMDADLKRAQDLAALLEKEAPSAAAQLFLARFDASRRKDTAAGAYAQALSINSDLPLAKIERTALELRRKRKSTLEELYGLHVDYAHLGKLRRLLFEAGE